MNTTAVAIFSTASLLVTLTSISQIDTQPSPVIATVVPARAIKAEGTAKLAAVVITKRDGQPIPAKAPPGVIVGFSVANSQSSYATTTGADGKPKAAVVWAVEIEPVWLREWVEVVDNGASIIVPTGTAKRIRVTAAVALGDTIAMQELVIAVNQPEVAEPDNKPKPLTPATPDTQLTGVAKTIYGLITSKVVLTAERKLTSAKIGQNFSDVSIELTKLAAGVPGLELFKDLGYIEAETLRRNKLAQGVDEAAWSDLFKTGIRDLLVAADDAGTLKTPADYQLLWAEIAAAFLAASK